MVFSELSLTSCGVFEYSLDSIYKIKMMDPNDFKDYKDTFILSAQKNLQSLKDALGKLQSTPSDKNSINTAYIAAHSLKGECYAMGFINTSSACEKIEKLFLGLKDTNSSASQALLQTVQKALSEIQASIQSIQVSDKENDLTSVVDELSKQLSL